MLEELQQAADRLRDTKATWIARRDAVDVLRKTAAFALATLHEQEEEVDPDVKRAVDAALAEANAALKGVPLEVPKEGYSLHELARACEKQGERELKPHRAGYLIEVLMKDGRRQKVYLESFRRKDGADLIRVYTYCGKYAPDSVLWALRANMKLAQAAIALTMIEGEERFVLTNCFLAKEATPAQVKAAVKGIAFYGDWLEKKLTGKDDF